MSQNPAPLGSSLQDGSTWVKGTARVFGFKGGDVGKKVQGLSALTTPPNGPSDVRDMFRERRPANGVFTR